MSAAPDPVALVTGASRGIGFGIAEALAAKGHRVAITARTEETVNAAAAGLGPADRVLAIPGNSGDPKHHAAAVEATLERFGRLDALVNNAGINPIFGPLIEAEPAAVRKIFDVNVLGTLGFTQAAHAQWMAANGGAIVNIGSVAGSHPLEGIGAYGASKAALEQLTRQLSVELAPRVRVNCIAPAVVQTSFAARLYADRESEVASSYPLDRLGTTADVAVAAAFLLSPEAGWITGQTLLLDGGLTARGEIGRGNQAGSVRPEQRHTG